MGVFLPLLSLFTLFSGSSGIIIIGFEQTDFQAEEESSIVQVCIRVLDGSLERNVLVDITSSDGAAIGGQDYVLVNERLTFTPVDSRRCVNVLLINDGILELEENLFLNLETDDPMVTLAPDQAEVIVTESSRVVIGFEQTLFQAEEESSMVQVCISILAGSLERNVLVDITSSDGAAIGGQDYVLVNEQLTFTPVDSRRCVNVLLINDDILELAENLFLNLETDDPMVTLAPDQAEVVVTESSTLMVQFQSITYSVTEGARVSLRAFLNIPADRAMTVDFTTNDGSAIAGSDYTTVIMTITFPAGTMEITIPVQTIDDTISERMEQFTAVLSNPSEGLALGADIAATVNIVDNDVAMISIIDDESTSAATSPAPTTPVSTSATTSDPSPTTPESTSAVTSPTPTIPEGTPANTTPTVTVGASTIDDFSTLTTNSPNTTFELPVTGTQPNSSGLPTTVVIVITVAASAGALVVLLVVTIAVMCVVKSRRQPKSTAVDKEHYYDYIPDDKAVEAISMSRSGHTISMDSNMAYGMAAGCRPSNSSGVDNSSVSMVHNTAYGMAKAAGRPSESGKNSVNMVCNTAYGTASSSDLGSGGGVSMVHNTAYGMAKAAAGRPSESGKNRVNMVHNTAYGTASSSDLGSGGGVSMVHNTAYGTASSSDSGSGGGVSMVHNTAYGTASSSDSGSGGGVSMVHNTAYDTASSSDSGSGGGVSMVQNVAYGTASADQDGRDVYVDVL